MAEFRYVLSSMIAATAAFLFLTQGCLGLRNVTLVISPQAVNRGQDVTLYCNYDLEKQPLYSVKWYRGKLEFYRFSPGESPATKIFYYPGINVDTQIVETCRLSGDTNKIVITVCRNDKLRLNIVRPSLGTFSS
ncbi:hypothetical protein M8J75_004376 [Diaphorina citri]|nr:hypothetical protein M8J75_004376 [Diaphorina citri]